jgi:hypothetical protein
MLKTQKSAGRVAAALCAAAAGSAGLLGVAAPAVAAPPVLVIENFDDPGTYDAVSFSQEGAGGGAISGENPRSSTRSAKLSISGRGWSSVTRRAVVGTTFTNCAAELWVDAGPGSQRMDVIVTDPSTGQRLASTVLPLTPSNPYRRVSGLNWTNGPAAVLFTARLQGSTDGSTAQAFVDDLRLSCV